MWLEKPVNDGRCGGRAAGATRMASGVRYAVRFVGALVVRSCSASILSAF
jgi:hypothetical protein